MISASPRTAAPNNELCFSRSYSLGLVACFARRDAAASRGAMLYFMMKREPEPPDTPCGCTNCYRLFSYADIADFWDDGETPVCPCCGSDNVVISTPEMIVDEHCLFAMRKTYH